VPGCEVAALAIDQRLTPYMDTRSGPNPPWTPSSYSGESRTPARSVPGYDVLGEIGRGGMGVVYRARQVGLNRVVALKMILAGQDAPAELRGRFRREAEAIARLRHPGIVQVHEVGESEGRPYLALEFVDGGSLADRLRAGLLQVPEAATLVEALARAIDHAHRAGVVHRDLKPANVLLHRRSEIQSSKSEGDSDVGCRMSDVEPKVTDFGLAKCLDEASDQTRSGAVLGTPNYMAPEQAVGKTQDVGPAADIYALGAILYECLTGRPPFKGATVLDTLEQVRSQEPVPPSQFDQKLPRDLETICLKCLRKEPQKRYAAAGDLADDLRRFLDQRPILARPVRLPERAVKWVKRQPALAATLLALAVALLGGTAGMAYLWRQSAASAERAENALRQLEKTQQERDWWMSVYAGLDREQRRRFREFQQFIRDNPAVGDLRPDEAIEAFNVKHPTMALAIPNLGAFPTAQEGGTAAAVQVAPAMLGD
jgi:serine/threonine protein kinase